MLAAIGDLGCDRMDPVERVDSQTGRARARVGRRADAEASRLRYLQPIQGDGGAGDVSGEPLDTLGVFGRDALLTVYGKRAGGGRARGSR